MKMTKRAHESGYALLSLLVGMTIGLIVLGSMLSKPTAQFTNQRENEEEMFFRAQNVGEAIRQYYSLKGGLAPQNLPTKLEDLLLEFNVQGRTLHIVRKASLIDPMTGKDWKPVRLGDPLIGEFLRTFQKVMLEQQAATLAGGGPAAAAQQQQMQQQMQFLIWAAQNSGINVANLNTTNDENKEDSNKGLASGFSLDGGSDSRPIVGVVSTFKKPMIRNYFGIATYDKAVIMPGVQTPLTSMGFGSQAGGGIGGPVTAPAQSTDPVPDTAPKLFGGRCPPGSTDPTCPRNQGGGTPPQ